MLSISSYATPDAVTFDQSAENTNQFFIAALKYYQAYLGLWHQFRVIIMYFHPGSYEVLLCWHRCFNLHIFLLITNQLFYFTDLTAFSLPFDSLFPAFRVPLGHSRAMANRGR
jgi:hypothetical protein